jgi:hypothetical protein
MPLKKFSKSHLKVTNKREPKDETLDKKSKTSTNKVSKLRR